MVSNPMIKCGIESMVTPMQKLFNLILRSTNFPQKWCLGDVVPIFKSGDASDPQHFRGLTLSSLMSKVFTTIINRRLTDHLNEMETLKVNQIGFC